MAGLYIHFPFCKQACHYCNFHFSTQIAKADSFHLLLLKELEMRYHFMDQVHLRVFTLVEAHPHSFLCLLLLLLFQGPKNY